MSHYGRPSAVRVKDAGTSLREASMDPRLDCALVRVAGEHAANALFGANVKAACLRDLSCKTTEQDIVAGGRSCAVGESSETGVAPGNICLAWLRERCHLCCRALLRIGTSELHNMSRGLAIWSRFGFW